MSYVFDNSPLSVLFKNFYRKRFPSLWENFDELVREGRLVSTREVVREIEDSSIESLVVWANEHPDIFYSPNCRRGRGRCRNLCGQAFSAKYRTTEDIKGWTKR